MIPSESVVREKAGKDPSAMLRLIAERAKALPPARRVEEARRDFDPDLHPRDRLGRWIRSLNLPAYRVGGSVRDRKLGKVPKDDDFMVMASPERIKERVLQTGGRVEDLEVARRLVGVRAYDVPGAPPEGVELAPPRVEVSTGPGHKDFDIVVHPDADVGGSEALDADAVRRDFTVNALYEDVMGGDPLDPTGRGLRDVEAGRLSTITPESFRDDPLRILRGLRFVSQHGLDPDEQTLRQMRDHAPSVRELSGERVQAELDKLLMGEHPGKALRIARDTGVLAAMLPELGPAIGFQQESKYHELTVDEHTIRVVEGVARQGGSLEARLAALFHDSGKPESAWRGKDGRLHYYASAEHGKEAHEDIGARIARDALARLRYPNATQAKVGRIVQEHMVSEANSPRAVKARRLRARAGDDIIADLLVHRRADMRAKGEDDDSRVDVAGIDKLERLVEQERDAPVTVADLAIRGDDLVALGIEGPRVGETLQLLLHEVVGNPDVNRREWLLRAARRANGLPGGERPEKGDDGVPGMYHVAPVDARDSIEEEGLRAAALPNSDQPRGVYLFRSLKDARNYKRKYDERAGFAAFDIWSVDPGGLSVEVDPVTTDAAFVADDIPATRVERVGRRAHPKAPKGDEGFGLTLTPDGFRAIHDGFTHGDLTLRERSHDRIGGLDGHRVKLDVVKGDGEVAGEVYVNYVKRSDGVEVELDYIRLWPGEQGTGFGTAWVRHAEKAYREQGVARITVTAADVGGYTWARQGFEFSEPPGIWRSGLRRHLQAEAADEIVERAGQEAFGRLDRFVQEEAEFPWQIASWGREFAWIDEATGQKMWPGKRYLIGNGWRGVKELSS